MILVDSSIWIDHLRAPDEALSRLLAVREVLVHPFVLGELALGMVKDREGLIATFRDLPQAPVAEADEVLALVAMHQLHGRGIGYVDAHLIAATLLTPEARLWSRDRRVMGVARELGIAAGTG